MKTDAPRGYSPDGRYLSDLLPSAEWRTVVDIDALCSWCPRVLVHFCLIRGRLVPAGQPWPGGAWPAGQHFTISIDGDRRHVPELRDPLRIVEGEPGAVRAWMLCKCGHAYGQPRQGLNMPKQIERAQTAVRAGAASYYVDGSPRLR